MFGFLGKSQPKSYLKDFHKSDISHGLILIPSCDLFYNHSTPKNKIRRVKP